MTLQQAVMLALQASILLTVFGFGLQATLHDVQYLLRHPGLLARSLLAMFMVMPVIAVVLGQAFELRPLVQIALIALAISPVPPLLPGKEGKAAGHAAYALSLMGLVSLLSIVVVPLSIAVLGRYYGRSFAMPLAPIARVVVTMTLLPLATGLACRALVPGVAARLARPIKVVATVLLLAGVVAILVATMPAFIQLVGSGSVLTMAAFVVGGLLVGHWLGGPNGDEATVLALSTATRHPAIALAVAKANFPDEPLLGATILLYVVVATLVSVPYVVLRRRALRAVAV
jgi:bile acid:Na+ symporter, BASS family